MQLSIVMANASTFRLQSSFCNQSAITPFLGGPLLSKLYHLTERGMVVSSYRGLYLTLPTVPSFHN